MSANVFRQHVEKRASGSDVPADHDDLKECGT